MNEKLSVSFCWSPLHCIKKIRMHLPYHQCLFPHLRIQLCYSIAKRSGVKRLIKVSQTKVEIVSKSSFHFISKISGPSDLPTECLTKNKQEYKESSHYSILILEIQLLGEAFFGLVERLILPRITIECTNLFICVKGVETSTIWSVFVFSISQLRQKRLCRFARYCRPILGCDGTGSYQQERSDRKDGFDRWQRGRRTINEERRSDDSCVIKSSATAAWRVRKNKESNISHM